MSDDLEERLVRIEARLTKIEVFLREYTRAAAGMDAKAPAPASSQTPAVEAKVEASKPPVGAPEKPSEPAKPGNWLGLVAVLCFVLAGGFIIKLSIDSGWLTPVRQVGLAALLGLGLIGAGLGLMKTDREYAGLLPAAGVIVLYLTTFAANRYYPILSFETALGVTGLISALCIWLYFHVRYEIYALTAAIGAYGAPVVLGMPADSDFSLYYFLLCSVAFATISIWVNTRILTIISAYLAIGLSAAIGQNLNKDLMIALVMAGHFVIFALGTYIHSRHYKQALSQAEAFGFLPGLLFFYASEYFFMHRIAPDLAPWVSLTFAVLLLALYLSARRFLPQSQPTQGLVLGYASVVAFHSVYIELLPEMARPWLFVVLMVALGLSGVGKAGFKGLGLLVIPVIAAFVILVAEYFDILYHLLQKDGFEWGPVALMAFGSLWFAIITAGKSDTTGLPLLASAHVLAIVGTYKLAASSGSVAVSALWLIYAAVVMGFGYVRRDAVIVKSALVILALAAGKALLYDASGAPTIVRIVCLMMTGVVLYGCGLLMRKTASWTSEQA